MGYLELAGEPVVAPQMTETVPGLAVKKGDGNTLGGGGAAEAGEGVMAWGGKARRGVAQ